MPGLWIMIYDMGFVTETSLSLSVTKPALCAKDPKGFSQRDACGTGQEGDLFYVFQKFSSLDKEEYPTNGKGRWLDFYFTASHKK